jgi:hypothetical protein
MKGMMMKSLTWDQVNAWRLAQHGLSPRLKYQDWVEAVRRTGGIQAQVMSAAELAVFTRVEGLSPEAVRKALWQERSLVKTWAMRGTLHLIAASELPVYVAARSLHELGNWAGYFAYYNITPAQQEAFLAAVPQVLGNKPMTRQELATAIAEETGAPHLGELIVSSSWGSPLKLSAFRGDLCFGPNQGQNITFVNPRVWLGQWQTIEPELALQEIARLYLRAYGPATPEAFARWWSGGAGKVLAKKLFQSIADELEEVEVEGWRAFALRTTLEPLQNLQQAETVQLLPLFDGYTFGLGRDMEPILPKAYQSQVFRPQGWISAVVLANGCIKGVWEYKIGRSQTAVKVKLFSPATASLQKGIEAEVERLREFFKSEVLLEWADEG